MTYTPPRPQCSRLDFNEANIITELCYKIKDRRTFMQRLSELEENTSDPYLVNCVEGLFRKLSPLSDAAFSKLMQDAEKGELLFPANYVLPKTSETSY